MFRPKSPRTPRSYTFVDDHEFRVPVLTISLNTPATGKPQEEILHKEYKIPRKSSTAQANLRINTDSDRTREARLPKSPRIAWSAEHGIPVATVDLISTTFQNAPKREDFSSEDANEISRIAMPKPSLSEPEIKVTSKREQGNKSIFSAFTSPSRSRPNRPTTPTSNF